MNNALNSDKYNSEKLDNLEDANPNDLANEGDKILNHILGPNKQNIISSLGSTLQMKESSIADIL